MPACLLLKEVATRCNFRTLLSWFLCVQAAKVPGVRGQISLLIFQSAWKSPLERGNSINRNWWSPFCGQGSAQSADVCNNQDISWVCYFCVPRASFPSCLSPCACSSPTHSKIPKGFCLVWASCQCAAPSPPRINRGKLFSTIWP